MECTTSFSTVSILQWPYVQCFSALTAEQIVEINLKKHLELPVCLKYIKDHAVQYGKIQTYTGENMKNPDDIE